MHYDPIKRSVGSVFNKSPFLRKLFYHLLDLLLLRAWHVHDELKKWSKGKGDHVNILDAGAGFGQHTFYLSGMNPNWKILAVDVKQEQVEDCNQFFEQIGRKNVKFEVADLTKFTIDNEYDLALSVDVMEHILEDVLVFKNICASLKPGGMLLISTPSDQGGSDVQGDGETSFIEEHVRDGYNIKEIEQKILSAGFSKVEARYSYGTPGKISWRLSMKYPIVMLGMSKLFFIILPFYYLITYPFAFVLNYLDTVTKHSTGTGLIVKAWK
jgi:SAM-dependent methyltransferase